MIYLIGSSGYNKDRSGYINLLKIGYTKDTGLNKRLDHYYLHNPTCYLIATIPEGDTTDESKLHQYFSKYKFKYYGNEWFDYNEDIIEFFKTHKTKESLNCLPEISSYKREELIEYLDKSIIYIINNDLFKDNKNSLYKFYKNLKSEIDKFETVSDLEIYLSKINNLITPDNINKLFESYELIKTTDIKQKLKDLKSLNYYYRLKELCKLKSNLSKDQFLYILYKLGNKFPIYFYALSPDKLNAFGYNIYKITKYLEIQTFDIKNLEKDIYSTFEVGKRYSNIYLKEKLGEIFDKNKYKKGPMASFINNYFNTKKVKICIEMGKRIDGLEIISKK